VKWARFLAFSVVALLLSFTRGAVAQDAPAQDTPPTRQATLAFDDKQLLRVSMGYRDIVDPATAEKLMGGLPTTISMRAYLFRESGGPWIAATFKQCRVIFDLWDEVYRIEISQSGSPDVVTASPTLEGVLRRCAESDRLAVTTRSLLPVGAKYYLGCVVEVNPVSTEMLDRIKRWVSRPSNASTTAPGDALFGSVVGLFSATRIGRADREITFRTQSF
jgi:hypothetical protein